MTHNITRTTTLLATSETSLKQIFRKIQNGGKYLLTIATDVPDAIPSTPVIYLAPPILPPHQLEVVLLTDSSYKVYWQEHNLRESIASDTKYHYEVLVNVGESTINETSAEIFQVDSAPFFYKNAKTHVIYSFAVRLVTEDGYRSQLSEIVSTENPGSKFPNLQSYKQIK